MLILQCEENKQVTGTPFLYEESEPSDLKLQETFFFVSKNQLLFLVSLKPNLFQLIFIFLLKLTLKWKGTNSLWIGIICKVKTHPSERS